MDFFQQQDRARRKSFQIILFFILGVVCVLAAIEFTACCFLADALNCPESSTERNEAIGILFCLGVGTILLIVGASVCRSSALRHGGGKSVAESMGGRLANPNRDIKERQLLNIVEEMALASGTPVPPVYVMDDEPGINAFAAGNSPEDAVVAVTSGALQHLRRDELQGVIGHEFSHILNGDMAANIRLMGVIFGIYVIYFIGWMIFRVSLALTPNLTVSSNDKKNNNIGTVRAILTLVGFWVMVIGSLGFLFANLMKAAFSRQREYLADASSAQFTRNPQGLANALKRIGGIAPDRQRIRTPAAAEASHLFFSELSASPFSFLFATHPPLEKRIMRLDSEFNPDFAVRMKSDATQESDATDSKKSSACSVSDHSGVSCFATRVDGMEYGATAALKEEELKEYAAQTPSFADFLIADEKQNAQPGKTTRTARATQKSQAVWGANPLPKPVTIRETIQNSLGATAYVLAILTDRSNQEIAEKQKLFVSQMFRGILVHDYSRLLAQTQPLSPVARLTNLQLALPAFRQLSPKQYSVARAGICALIEADSQVDLNEFVIYSMVCRHLDIVFGLRKPSANTGKMTLSMFRAAVVVLSRLAYVGSEIPAEQEKAFRVGLRTLNIADANLLPRAECSNDRLQKALTLLDQMEMGWKRDFFKAAIQTIQADGKETDDEAILRFGIAAMLGIYA